MADNSEDPYTSKPTHLRVYREETGDDWPWHLDGADNEGRYTKDVWRFSLFEEAVTKAAKFVAQTTEYDGVVWNWDNRRRTTLRPAIVTSTDN